MFLSGRVIAFSPSEYADLFNELKYIGLKIGLSLLYICFPRFLNLIEGFGSFAYIAGRWVYIFLL